MSLNAQYPCSAPSHLCEAEARRDLINLLHADGYVSADVADEFHSRYVDTAILPLQPCHSGQCVQTPDRIGTGTAANRWLRMLSLVNFVKICAIIFLLIAFQDVLVKVAKLLARIPVEILQCAILTVAIGAALWPQVFWRSQASYIAILGSFAVLFVLVWIIISHDKLVALLKRAQAAGWPVGTIFCAAGIVYFAALAVVHSSKILGFFTAVGYSGVLGFGMAYAPHVISLYFGYDRLPAVVFGHLAALVPFCALEVLHIAPVYTTLFEAGLKYYCTIAMGCGFFVGSSPWYSAEEASYVLEFQVRQLHTLTHHLLIYDFMRVSKHNL
jgi:hypothetical protein